MTKSRSSATLNRAVIWRGFNVARNEDAEQRPGVKTSSGAAEKNLEPENSKLPRGSRSGCCNPLQTVLDRLISNGLHVSRGCRRGSLTARPVPRGCAAFYARGVRPFSNLKKSLGSVGVAKPHTSAICPSLSSRPNRHASPVRSPA